jgi:hypothetical protein
MSDQIIQRYIKNVMESMVQLAEGTMMNPPDDDYKVRQIFGRYQGMQQSLDILDDILRDVNEEENAHDKR